MASPQLRQFIIATVKKNVTPLTVRQENVLHHYIDRLRLTRNTDADIELVKYLISEAVKLFTKQAQEQTHENMQTHEVPTETIHNYAMNTLYETPSKTPSTALAIETLFGYTEPATLQFAFNPEAARVYHYIPLDSRYRDHAASSPTQYSWSYSREIQTPVPGQIISNVAITNIVAMRLYSVAMPENFVGIDRAELTGSISAIIQEFDTQITAFSGNLKYHFLGQFIRGTTFNDETSRVVTDDPQGMTFYFRQPIRYLDSITLSFGNPDQRISFYPDYREATCSYAPGLILFTFAEPHNIVSQVSTMCVASFTTADPAAGNNPTLITRINAPPGIIVNRVDEYVLQFDTNVDPVDPINNLTINVYLVGLQLITFIEFISQNE